jgi:hypothetical protein
VAFEEVEALSLLDKLGLLIQGINKIACWSQSLHVCVHKKEARGYDPASFKCFDVAFA